MDPDEIFQTKFSKFLVQK